MVKAKKLLIVLLIVTILMPFLPQNTSKASSDSGYNEWSEEYQEGFGFEIKGLTIAQRTYFAKYIRAYMKDNHEMSEKMIIYDSSSYSTLAYQNEKPLRDVLRSGQAVPSGKVYSQKIPLSCAYFTAGMLHHALNIDFDKYYRCYQNRGYFACRRFRLCRYKGKNCNTGR